MKDRTAMAQAIAATGVTCALLLGPASIAHAEESSPDASEALQALENLDALSAADSNSAVLQDLSVDASTVTIPLSPSDPVVLTGDTGTVAVNIPYPESSGASEAAGEGVSVYPNAQNFSTIPLVKEDDSVQFTTVINDSNAPTEFTYTFPKKLLELQADGLVTVRNDDGTLAGLIAPAWAKDANGQDVSTHYSANGSTLTQIVEHIATSAYPVVADPYLGQAQIQSIGTAYRDPRGVTKVVTPTAWGRLNGNNPTAVNGLRDEWNSKAAPAYRTNDMWWQLGCHAQFAPIKSTWNLDSYLRRGSYAAYIANGCN